MTLNGANTLTYLGGFTTANGNFALTDTQTLQVTSALNAGTGNVSLTTTGTGTALSLNAAVSGATIDLTAKANLTIQAPITGATVDLVASTVDQVSGYISASTLTGSVGSASLTANNVISILTNFSGSGGFVLTDTVPLQVTGTVSSNANNNVELFDTGGGIDAHAAVIEVGVLSGSSEGAALFTNSANAIGDLGGFTTNNGALSVTSSTGLSVIGTLNAGTASIDLVSGGTLVVGAAQTVATGTTLTLDASTLAVNATVTVSGTGNVVLDAGYTTVSGTPLLNLSFGQNALISYGGTNQGGTLTINGTPYTLLYTLSDIQGASGSGTYALADSITASGTYTAALVPTLSGTFEGLGNSISNLTINDTSANATDGLFGTIAASGVVRDLSLTNPSITGGSNGAVGALAGENLGTIANVTVGGSSGSVQGTASTEMEGGLVGNNNGLIDNASVITDVTGFDGDYLGGLAGTNGFSYLGSTEGTGTILNSTVGNGSGIVAEAQYALTSQGGLGGFAGANAGTIQVSSTASGANVAQEVSSQDTGGFVGTNSGTIVNSGGDAFVDYEAASGNVGGAVGSNTGQLQYVASNRTVTASSGATVGGIVGNNTGSITSSYALGNVTGGSNADIGGLVGNNGSTGSITNSFARGTATGTSSSYIGGLVGYSSGTVSESYATGLGSGNVRRYHRRSHRIQFGNRFANLRDRPGTRRSHSGCRRVDRRSLFERPAHLISNSYATGNVSAGSNSNVGGLLGLNSQNVSYVYSTGTVAADRAAMSADHRSGRLRLHHPHRCLLEHTQAVRRTASGSISS